MSDAHILVHFRLNFFIDANNMNADQTAPQWVQSDLGPYCLIYRPQSISRRESRQQNQDWREKGKASSSYCVNIKRAG